MVENIFPSSFFVFSLYLWSFLMSRKFWMFIWWDLSAFLWVVWLSVPRTGFSGEWLLGPCLRSPCDQLGGGKEKILIIASFYKWGDGGSTMSKQHGPRFLALTLSAQGFFCYVIVWMWELDCEESWTPKNICFWTVMLEKTLESPLDCKEIQPVHSKGDQSWVFFGRNDAKAEIPVLWPLHAKWELTHWKRLWCWEGLGAGEEGNDRGDGWMASLTRWTWVLVNSGSWWWTGRPGMLRFMGSQRVGHDWVTELNWYST